jgi:hypothetical protein
MDMWEIESHGFVHVVQTDAEEIVGVFEDLQDCQEYMHDWAADHPTSGLRRIAVRYYTASPGVIWLSF